MEDIMNDPKVMEFLSNPNNRDAIEQIQKLVKDPEFQKVITESDEAKALTKKVMQLISDKTGIDYNELEKAEVLLRKGM